MIEPIDRSDSVAIFKTGVVILNYKTHDLTVQLANCIAAYPSVDHVCVVDNCSGDYFIQDDFQSDKIVYFTSDHNGGYSYGNNIGLRYLCEELGCDYLFIANPDVLVTEDCFTSVCKYFNEHPDVALCAPCRYGFGNSSIHQYFDFPTIGSALKSCFFLTRRLFEKERRQLQNSRVSHEEAFRVDAVPGAFFGARSDFLKMIGYMPADIFMYGEEIVLGKQAQLAGYTSAIVCASRYVHNHEMKRFSNVKAFINDHKSLELYFERFDIGSKPGRVVLHACTVFGCIEYRTMSAIAGFLKRV